MHSSMKYTTCLMSAIFSCFLSPYIYAANSDQIGHEVVTDLNNRYLDQSEGCGSNKKLPAFECSGIIFRATGNGNYAPWNPSPVSQTSGGVSFSYWRVDVNPGAYGGNGYIFNAPARSEADKKHTLMCFVIFHLTQTVMPEGGRVVAASFRSLLMGKQFITLVTAVLASCRAFLQRMNGIRKFLNRHITPASYAGLT